MKPSHIAAACSLAATAALVPAHAQVSGDVIRIGFITDMSGLYSDIDGPAGAEAIKMAIADADHVAGDLRVGRDEGGGGGERAGGGDVARFH